MHALLLARALHKPAQLLQAACPINQTPTSAGTATTTTSTATAAVGVVVLLFCQRTPRSTAVLPVCMKASSCGSAAVLTAAETRVEDCAATAC
jgi:hypothetical protein